LFEPKVIHVTNQSKPRIIPRNVEPPVDEEIVGTLSSKEKDLIESIGNNSKTTVPPQTTSSSTSSTSNSTMSSTSDLEQEREKKTLPRAKQPASVKQDHSKKQVEIVSTSSAQPSVVKPEPNKSYIYVNYVPKKSEQNNTHSKPEMATIRNGNDDAEVSKNPYLRGNVPHKAETYIFPQQTTQQNKTNNPTVVNQKPTLTLKSKTKGFIL
jgi:hypothetical protein